MGSRFPERTVPVPCAAAIKLHPGMDGVVAPEVAGVIRVGILIKGEEVGFFIKPEGSLEGRCGCFSGGALEVFDKLPAALRTPENIYTLFIGTDPDEVFRITVISFMIYKIFHYLLGQVIFIVINAAGEGQVGEINIHRFSVAKLNLAGG